MLVVAVVQCPVQNSVRSATPVCVGGGRAGVCEPVPSPPCRGKRYDPSLHLLQKEGGISNDLRFSRWVEYSGVRMGMGGWVFSGCN